MSEEKKVIVDVKTENARFQLLEPVEGCKTNGQKYAQIARLLTDAPLEEGMKEHYAAFAEFLKGDGTDDTLTKRLSAVFNWLMSVSCSDQEFVNYFADRLAEALQTSASVDAIQAQTEAVANA